VRQRGLLAVAAVFLGLAGVALLGAALVDDPLALLDELHPGRYVASGLAAARDLLPRLALAVLAGVLLTGCYLAIRSWTPLPGSTARPALLAVRRGSTHLPSTQKVDERLRRFQRRHPERAAVLFFRMLTDNKYWLRLEEVFTVVGRNVHLQSRAQFQFDRDELGAERERLVVPLLVLPKGALLDDLVVTDDAGNRVGGAVAVRQPFRRRARAARPVLRDAAGGRSRPRAGRLRATRHDLKERIRRFVGLEARRIRIPANPTRRFANYQGLRGVRRSAAS